MACMYQLWHRDLSHRPYIHAMYYIAVYLTLHELQPSPDPRRNWFIIDDDNSVAAY